MKTNYRGKKERTFRNTIFIIFFLMGLVLVLQLKSGQDSNVFFNREALKDLELQLFLETKETERLEEYLKRRNRELDELSSPKNNKDLFEIIKKQKDFLMSINGLSSLKGPGIRIEVRDSDKEILFTENPNDFVVHDQDILNIINDLKIAEAEAISVNNQILMADTEIKCSGATITINDRTYAQPFIIRAIGNPQQLEAAVKSKESYAFMISSLYGINIKIEQKEKIEILGYKLAKKNSYLREGKF